MPWPQAGGEERGGGAALCVGRAALPPGHLSREPARAREPARRDHTFLGARGRVPVFSCARSGRCLCQGVPHVSVQVPGCLRGSEFLGSGCMGVVLGLLQ